MKQFNNRAHCGFTLIELIIVIAILGILATGILTVINVGGTLNKADIAKAKIFSKSIENDRASQVGWWSFEEGTGTLANDSSSFSNDGTVIDAAMWRLATDPTCKELNFGGCLSFDVTSVKYFIKNPFNNFPTSEITVAFWMKSSDTTNAGTPFSYASSGHANDFVVFNYKDFSIHRGSSVDTNTSANDGNWHHIAVTWQGSDGKTELHKDGKLVFTGTLASGTSITSGGSLVLGQEQDSVGGGFDSNQAFLGNLDEVSIYNQALTSYQIRELYAQGQIKRVIAYK